jgi:hypothetical protein
MKQSWVDGTTEYRPSKLTRDEESMEGLGMKKFDTSYYTPTIPILIDV